MMIKRTLELIRRGRQKPPHVIARWLARQIVAEWEQFSGPRRARALSTQKLLGLLGGSSLDSLWARLSDAPFPFHLGPVAEDAYEAACPGDAISPAADFIVTGGIKRWLIDNEKCFPYSRLKQEYCHICVDVCPYIHKENGDPEAKRIFKEYLGLRKAAGAGAAKSGVAAAGAKQ